MQKASFTCICGLTTIVNHAYVGIQISCPACHEAWKITKKDLIDDNVHLVAESWWKTFKTLRRLHRQRKLFKAEQGVKIANAELIRSNVKVRQFEVVEQNELQRIKMEGQFIDDVVTEEKNLILSDLRAKSAKNVVQQDIAPKLGQVEVDDAKSYIQMRTIRARCESLKARAEMVRAKNLNGDKKNTSSVVINNS